MLLFPISGFIKSVDVKSAFLQGKIVNRDIYLKPQEHRNCETKSNSLWTL